MDCDHYGHVVIYFDGNDVNNGKSLSSLSVEIADVVKSLHGEYVVNLYVPDMTVMWPTTATMWISFVV